MNRVVLTLSLLTTPTLALNNNMTNRRGMLTSTVAALAVILGQQQAVALSSVDVNNNNMPVATPLQTTTTTAYKPVAYKGLTVNIPEYNVDVPVACWFPTAVASNTNTKQQVLTYPHRISVKRIGELLAGWDFIPNFVSRNFKLKPTMLNVANGNELAITGSDGNRKLPVIILAHGFLGSRFDLSHLAEALAQDGFVCLAPEFPESLAASYQRVPGLDRKVITNKLLASINDKLDIVPSKFGIIGHSLGCGTAIDTGDDSWTRVLIAGFPRQRDGSPLPGKKLLFISSTNDGAVSMSSKYGRAMTMPTDLQMLQQNDSMLESTLPNRAALIFDRDDAPNHISFLSASVNDAMINLLSPLLPVAQAMNIPVLDFDKYKTSRDSVPTAAVLHPLIRKFMNQHMMG